MSAVPRIVRECGRTVLGLEMDKYFDLCPDNPRNTFQNTIDDSILDPKMIQLHAVLSSME